MKKKYQAPNSLLVYIRGAKLMATSMTVYDTQVDEGLSRDFDAWDDED